MNQCDGCQRRLPRILNIRGNYFHKLEGVGNYPGETQSCTKDRYVSEITSCLMSDEFDSELGTV
jgi:hypothetical protein